ncbi:hypothetical protein ACTFIY_007307 [Dictyostelium cf. discoideum]
MSIIAFSPHRDNFINDLNKKDKKFDLTDEELSEIDLRKLNLENEQLKQLDNSSEILRAILWNSKGDSKAGYAAFRKLLSKIITKDFNFDLFITQEPVSVVDKNYIDNYFNNNFGIVYPVKRKARNEVAIVYRKEKIKLLKNENPYSLIEESITKDNVKYSNFFCNERFNLLVAGDFNYDIFSKDFPDLILKNVGLNIVIPLPPTIDSSYNEEEIAPSNIDYFITVHDVKNGLNFSNVHKLPIRFDNYQNDFEGVGDLRQNKDLMSSKVSTHDPQFCCLNIKSE